MSVPLSSCTYRIICLVKPTTFTLMICAYAIIAEGKSRVRAGFTQLATAACENACAQAKELLPQIVAGDITVCQFKALWKNFSNVQRLVKNVNGRLSKDISTVLPQRWEEIQKFEMHFNNLCYLCRNLPPQIQGL